MNNLSGKEDENSYYDKYADFYYTNLINSLVLFSMTTVELEKLVRDLFDPISELASEIDYAFTPVCFETIFRNHYIDNSFRNELLEFKNATDCISSEIWDWEFIDNHEVWIFVRRKANSLLDKLGIESRIINEKYHHPKLFN